MLFGLNSIMKYKTPLFIMDKKAEFSLEKVHKFMQFKKSSGGNKCCLNLNHTSILESK